MSNIKSCFVALGQFIIGFFVWAVFLIIFNNFIFSTVQRLFNYDADKGFPTTVIVLIINQLIGLGLAVLAFRRKLRWMGIGIVLVIFLFILGALLHGCGILPLLLPFPISLISGC